MGKSRDDYDNVVQWFIDNIPISQFDSFEDWYNQCRAEIQTDELFNSDRFNSKLRDAYFRNGGTDSPREIREFVEDSGGEIPEETLQELEKREKSDAIIDIDTPAQITAQQRIPVPPSIEPERLREIPPTGRAPELPKPEFKEPRKGFLTRLRERFSRRKKSNE